MVVDDQIARSSTVAEESSRASPGVGRMASLAVAREITSAGV